MAQSRLSKSQSENSIQNQKREKNKYIHHLPMLVVAIIASVWTAVILSHYYPWEIANTIVYQSYLALLIPLFITISFSVGYLMINLQKGIIISWLFTTIVFFRLQNIELSLVYYFLLFFIAIILLSISKVLKS